jgi:hypothetical protein
VRFELQELQLRPGFRLGLLFFLFFLLRFFAFFHGSLEVTDAFAHTLAQGGELAGAEEQKEDSDDDQQMPRLKKTLTHNSSTGYSAPYEKSRPCHRQSQRAGAAINAGSRSADAHPGVLWKSILEAQISPGGRW